MKITFDIIVSFFVLLIISPILLVLIILVRLSSKGPAIHWSNRVGQNNAIFKMPKFRSMYIDTPDVATHLLKDSQTHITPLGSFMRKTSLDELPQLWSIFTGKMSFVGPRPALHNQYDLIELRTNKGIEKYKPGLTGWAQINGRDEIPIPQKVDLDEYYCIHSSFLFDIKIIIKTFANVIFKKDIAH